MLRSKQPRAHQQHNGQRDFSYHKGTARPWPASCGARGRLTHGRMQMVARCLHAGGNNARDYTDERSKCEREEEDWAVNGDGVEAWATRVA